MQSVYLKYQPYEISFDTELDNASEEVLFDCALDALKTHIENINLRNIQIQRQFVEQEPSGGQNFRFFINGHPPEKLFSYHSHNFIEGNLVLKGSCLEYIDNQPFILKGGDILFMSAGYLAHSCYGPPGSVVRNLMLSPDLFDELLTEAVGIPHFFMKKLGNGNTYVILRGLQPEVLSDYAEESMRVYNYDHLPDMLEHCYAEHLLKSFLFRLQMAINAKTVTMDASTVKVLDRSVENILQYIHDNYTKVTMNDLVRTFGYSERQILRFIKKYTGNSFNGCVTADRVFHAEKLLAMTNLPIPRIAEMVGLESTSYFSRMFHSQTGMSPLAYRKYRKASQYTSPDEAVQHNTESL